MIQCSFYKCSESSARKKPGSATVLEMDRMSKFAYPRMRIGMRITAREAPRMRIFVTYLNNTSYLIQIITLYRILITDCRGL